MEEESLIDVMAFMVIMKNSGPKVKPCGTRKVVSYPCQETSTDSDLGQ